MGEGKFTPGTWAVFQCGTIRTSWLEVKTADGKTTICKLNNQLALANAIAAAPEMYAALSKIATMQDIRDGAFVGDKDEIIRSMTQLAVSALSKAEGRDA